MMTPQSLQILSSKDSLARLGIVTNNIVIVNIVLRVSVARCRSLPVYIESFTDLFFLHSELDWQRRGTDVCGCIPQCPRSTKPNLINAEHLHRAGCLSLQTVR